MTSLRRSLFLAPWLLCSALIAQAATPLEGRWEGTIAVPGATIVMVLDLAPASGSTWVGSVVLPGFGIKGAPAGELIVGDDNVRLTLPSALRGPSDDVPALQARATDAQTLVGEFRLAGLTAPLRLTRTGAAQVDRPPASTAIASTLVGKWIGSYELGGYARQVTLTLAMDGENASAQMVIVGKRTSEIPFDLIRQSERFLTLQSAETGVSYEGQWRTANGEIVGTFQQGPFEAPLTFRRASGGAS